MCSQSLTLIWNPKLWNTKTTLISLKPIWRLLDVCLEEQVGSWFWKKILFWFRYWSILEFFAAGKLTEKKDSWKMKFQFLFMDQLIITPIKMLRRKSKYLQCTPCRGREFFLAFRCRHTGNLECIWNASKQRRKKSTQI